MRYLAATEVEEIKQLRAANSRIKDIARRFGVCEGTISNIVNGKTGARTPKKNRRYLRIPLEPAFEIQDFSTLPDHILFKHVRVWDFIG